MAAGAVSSARDTPHDVRWKWVLLGLCALAGVLIIAAAADWLGVGGRPWYGLWQSLTTADDGAYMAEFTSIIPGGVSANAGLRDGDRIDLREQSFEARVRFSGQPMASHALTLRVHRGARKFSATVLGGIVSESSVTAKFSLFLVFALEAWFLACATLIAGRRWWRYEASVLALVMLCQVGSLLLPINIVAPTAELQLLFTTVALTLGFLGAILLVALSSRYGKRVSWRRPLECLAYTACAVSFLISIAAIVGLTTLWFDPIPYLSLSGFIGGGNPVILTIVSAVPGIAVAFCALASVATAPLAERPRVAWLLLPLPLAFAVGNVIGGLSGVATSYYEYLGLLVISNSCYILGAFTVSYALLKRRVLDFSFVLNRAVVVSIVGLIVVIAFVLLEWVLGSVLTGVSHATGLIANVALALVIGVSLSYIHKRADRFVDAFLFRKRHDDERALLEFSKEASYVTNAKALLDQSVEKIRRHTDARSVSLLLDEAGVYRTVRSFGDGMPAAVGENDAAILALKTWHRPIDPHHYDTTLHAALALPMLSRGRLLGVLSLGERSGGEAYAPDEVEALSQFAHGVGFALDALSSTDGNSMGALRESITAIAGAMASNTAAISEAMASNTSAIAEAMATLPRAVAAELRDNSPEIR
jgi:hypothetical protein